MRTLILAGLFVAMSACAGAAERVTVDQMEQKLAALLARPPAASSLADEAATQSDLLHELNEGLGTFGLDADQATEIDALELTERLTTTTLARLRSQYKPGPAVRHALEQLADRSALLDPPDAELPHQPPPDLDSQRKMVDSAGNYVLRVLSRLPNFFAIRTTERFDDAPVTVNGSVVVFPTSLHLVGSSGREITFRDGSEIVDPLKQERVMPGMPDAGLASSGEFGPEAAIVLSDLAKGTIEFHHWEQMPAGLAAVYRYSVPKKISNYQVDSSCGPYVSFHDTPGYHGSLAIDPVSGAIFRLTLEADSKKGDPVTHVASVIDYGPVVIGGRRYICPLRSLAFMVEDVNACVCHAPKEKMMRPVTMLNRSSFSDYHRLGSTARLVAEPSETPSAAPPARNH